MNMKGVWEEWNRFTFVSGSVTVGYMPGYSFKSGNFSTFESG